MAGLFMIAADSDDLSSAEAQQVSSESELIDEIGRGTPSILITGSFSLTSDLNIPVGIYVTVGEGKTLTIPASVHLRLNGALSALGTLANDGLIDGSGCLFHATAASITGTGSISDVYRVNISDALAKITTDTGTFYFSALRDAMLVATNGQTVVILTDILTSKIPGPQTAITVNLDLNGHTVESTEANLLIVGFGCTLNIDGTTSGSKIIGKVGIADNNTTLTINGGTYEASVADDAVVYTNGTYSGQNLTISNATFSSTDDTFYLAGNGTYNISNCTITGYTGIYMKGGQLTLTNVTVTATGAHSDPSVRHDGASSTGDGIILDSLYGYPGQMSLVIDSDSSVSSTNSYGIREFVSINSTESTLLIDVHTSDITGSLGDLTLTNDFITSPSCTFNTNDCFDVRNGLKYYTDFESALSAASANDSLALLKDVTIEGDLTISKPIELSGAHKLSVTGTLTANANITLNGSAIEAETISGSGIIAEARIGTTYYGALRDAILAAVNNDTVIVLKDVTTSKLAGPQTAITVNLNLNGHVVTSTEANLLIIGFGCTLNIDGTTTGSKMVGKVGIAGNNTTLTINGGTYEASVADDAVIYTNGTFSGQNLTISNATFSSTDDTFYLAGNGTYSVSNCTITGYTGIYMKGGQLTLTNVTVTATGAHADPSIRHDGASSTGDGIILDSLYGYPGQMSLTVSGTTQITSSHSYGIREFVSLNSDESTLLIDVDSTGVSGYLGDLTLTQTFLDSESCTFVPHDSFDAQNGLLIYTQITRALSEASSGATLKLLKDVTVGGDLTISNPVTLTGGHKLTVTGTLTLDEDITLNGACVEAASVSGDIGVARIGDIYYGSLADAAAHAVSSDTIVVLTAITLDDTVTTIRAGVTLTFKHTDSADPEGKIIIPAGRTLEINGTLDTSWFTGNGSNEKSPVQIKKVTEPTTVYGILAINGTYNVSQNMYDLDNRGKLEVKTGGIVYVGSVRLIGSDGLVEVNAGKISMIQNSELTPVSDGYTLIIEGTATVPEGKFYPITGLDKVVVTGELIINGTVINKYLPYEVARPITNNGTITIGANGLLDIYGSSLPDRGALTNNGLITGGTLRVETIDLLVNVGMITDVDVVCSKVAKIGTKNYDTIQDAIDDAAAGNVIEVVCDVELSSALNISGKSITLDLGGHTITISGTYADLSMITVTSSGETGDQNTVTIRNGTLTSKSPVKTAILAKSVILEVTGLTVTSTYGQCVQATVNGSDDDPATVTLSDVSVSVTGNSALSNAEKSAVVSAYGAIVNIRETTLTSVYSESGYALHVAESGGTINVFGGTFAATSYVLYVRNTNMSGGKNTSAANISAGEFSGTVSATGSNNGTATIAVSGGFFDTCPDYRYAASGYVFYEVSENRYSVRSGSYVARIGSIGYETIQGAVDAAGTGATIYLISDIELTSKISISKSLTIDLGTHTVSISEDYSQTVMFDIWSSITSGDLPSVILTNGTIVSDSPVATAVSVRSMNASLSNLAINSTDGQCLNATKNGGALSSIVSVTGCSFTHALSGEISDVNKKIAVSVAYSSAITMDSSAVTAASGYAFYVLETGGTITIQSGDYTGGIYVLYTANDNSYSNESFIYVNGGTFTGIIGTSQAEGTSSRPFISGGQFSVIPNYLFVSAGTVVSVDISLAGYYVAHSGTYVAHIGDIGYETVRDALEKGADGIVLFLNDADIMQDITAAGTHTLSLDGHSLTFRSNTTFTTLGASVTIVNSGLTGTCSIASGASLTINGEITLSGIVMHDSGGTVTGDVLLINVATLSEDTFVYTGSAFEPTVTIMDNGTPIYTGFDVVYANNTNAGTASATATFTTGYVGCAVATFTINKAEQSIAFNDDDVETTFELDTYKQLPIRVSGDGDITYYVNDETVATVAADGTVTFVKIGVVIVTAQAAATQNYNQTTASYTLTIGKGEQTISVTSPQNVTYSPGGTFSIGATVTKGDGSLTYSSGNTSIVTIDEDGIVTIVKSGSAIITITAGSTANYNSKSVDCTVNINKADQNIVFRDAVKIINFGTTGYSNEITSEVYESPSYSYSSGDESIVTVNSDGILVLHKEGGPVTITVNTTATTNYNAGSANYIVTVQAIGIEYTHDSFVGTYDGQPHSISLTVTFPTVYTLEYRTSEQAVYVTDKPSFVDAGVYTVYYRITATGFTTVISSDTVTINKAPSSITIDEDQEFNYGILYTIATSDKVGTGNVTFSYFDSSQIAMDIKPVNVGTYYVIATVAESANYSAYTTPDKVSFKINKVAPTYTAPQPIADLVYDGTAQELTSKPTVIGGVLQFRLGTGDWGTAVIKGTNAGDYTIQWQIVGDSNHTSVEPTGVTGHIDKADITDITGPSAVGDLIYNGADQALITAGSSSQGVLMYGPAKVGDYSQDLMTGKNAGSYTVWWFIKGSANYNDTVPASLNNTIGRKALTESMVTISDDKPKYTGANQDVEFTVKDGTPSKIVASDYEVSGKTGKNVNSYTLTITGSDTGNYVGELSFGWQIVKVKLTITAEDKTVTYNDAKPVYTVTYSGFVGGETKDVLDGSLAFACDYVKGSPVDTYTIVPSGLSSDNYNIVFENGTLTVNAKTLTLINGGTAVTKTYDGTDSGTVSLVYGTHYSFTGIVGEDSVDLKNKTYHYLLATVDVQKAVLASTELNNDNYVLASGEFNATITPREVTINGVVSDDKTYNGSDAAVFDTEDASISWVYTGDDVSIDSSSASAKFSNERAGTEKTVTFSGFKLTGAKMANYKLSAQPASVKNDIIPAVLTVSNGTTPIVKPYDGNKTGPAITLGVHYKFTGVVGDDVVDFSNNACEYDVATTSATTVTILSLVLNNSDYTISSAVLTASISNFTVVITWCEDSFKYNGTVQTVTATYVAADGNTVDLDISMDSTFKDYGTYTATADFKTAAEKALYSLPDEHTKSYTMQKRVVHLISATELRFYNGLPLQNTNITNEPGDDGFVTGEGVNCTSFNSITVCTKTDADFESVPNTFIYTYKSGTKEANYDIIVQNGTLSIYKRSVTLTSGSSMKPYDGTPLTNSTVTWTEYGEGTGFVEGEGVNYTCTGSQTEIGQSYNVFTYTMKAGTLQTNYIITTVFGTLAVGICDITDADLDISYVSELYYTGTSQTFTINYIKLGDQTVTYDTDPVKVNNIQTNVNRSLGEVTYYEMTIEGTGSYTGVKHLKYWMLPVTIDDGIADIDEDQLHLTYNGYEQTVIIKKVTVDTATFTGTVPTSQYVVTGNIAKDYSPTGHTITITGGYNFTGTITAQYDISRINLLLQSKTKTQDFNGMALSATNIEETGFVGTDGILRYYDQPEITNVGSVSNTFSYEPKVGTVLANYIIEERYGTLTVNACDINTKVIVNAIPDQTYNAGSEPLPVAYINNGDSRYTLKLGTDYTLSYSNNIHVTTYSNKAKVTLTAVENGNFKNSKTAEFNIVRKTLNIQSASAEKMYDGTVLVYHDYWYDSGFGPAGSDNFVITWIDDDNFKNVGTRENKYTATPSPGTLSSDYQVFQKYGILTITTAYYDVSTIQLEDGVVYTYDRYPHRTEFTGTLPTGDGKPVAYQYTSPTYTNVTDGFVDVTLVLSQTSSNYKFKVGESSASTTYTLSATMKIDPADVSLVTIMVASTPKYNGELQTIPVQLTYAGKMLTSSDYILTGNSATDAGNYVATLVLIGNFSGTKDVDYQILKRETTLTSASATKTYDRSPLTAPNIIITGDKWVGSEGDYVTYNISGTITNAGSVENTFTYEFGSGIKASNYNIKAVNGTLKINPAKMSDVKVGEVQSYKYDATPKSPVPTVTYLGIELIEGTEFYYSYTNNVNASTSCKVNINAMNGNFSGTKSVSFTIEKRTLKVESISASKDYDGQYSTFSSYEIKVGECEGLAGNDTFTVTMHNKYRDVLEEQPKNTFTCNFSPSTAKDNYSITYVAGTIIVRPISMTLTLVDDVGVQMSKIYDGKKVSWKTSYYTITPSLISGGPDAPTVEYKLVTEGEEKYTTTVPKDAGTYNLRVTVVGTNNFSGDVDDTKTFTIAPIDISLRSHDLTSPFTNQPIYCKEVDVTGVFVTGEGLTYTNFKTVNAAGTFPNTFEYEFKDGTLGVNYNIAVEYGTLTVTALDYDMTGIKFAKTSFVYDGLSHQPVLNSELPIGIDGIQLTVQYVGDYRTNVTDGTGYVTAYFSTASLGYNVPAQMSTSFNISKLSIEGAICILGDDLTYNGQPQAKEVKSVIVNGNLYATFNVEGNVQTDAGDSYLMRITGIDNFSGSIQKNYSILKRHITLTSASGSFVYDNTSHTLPTVSVGGNFAPDEGMNFTNFARCTNVGEYDNSFDWSYKSNTKEYNYDFRDSDITYGKITIEKAVQDIYFETKQVSKYIRDDDFINTLYQKNVYTKIIYSSDDPNVASVDENGKVTIKKIGSANITARTEDSENCYPDSDYYMLQISLYGIRIAGVEHGAIDVQKNGQSITSSDANQVLDIVVSVDPGYDCYEVSITNLSGSASVDKTEVGRITRSTGEVIITYRFLMPAMVIQVDASIKAHIMEHHDPQVIDCTHSGNVEYWRCSHCGNYFLDALGKSEPVKENEIIQPAYGHDPTYIGSSGGMIAHWNCRRCDVDFADSECTITIFYDLTEELGMVAVIGYEVKGTSVSDPEIQSIQTIIEKVKEEGVENITVKFTCTGTSVSFSSEYIRAIGIQNANIKIEMTSNTVIFTPTTLEYIDFTGTENSLFQLHIEKTDIYNSKYKSILNEYCSDVMEFSLIVNGNLVSYLGDLVPTTVTFNYTLAEGKNPKSLSVWYLGTDAEVYDCVYDDVNHTVTFETTHFSPFVVVYDEPEALGIERVYFGLALAGFMFLYIMYFGFIRNRKYNRRDND